MIAEIACILIDLFSTIYTGDCERPRPKCLNSYPSLTPPVFKCL